MERHAAVILAVAVGAVAAAAWAAAATRSRRPGPRPSRRPRRRRSPARRHATAGPAAGPPTRAALTCPADGPILRSTDRPVIGGDDGVRSVPRRDRRRLPAAG